jgi:hypothetical protein
MLPAQENFYTTSPDGDMSSPLAMIYKFMADIKQSTGLLEMIQLGKGRSLSSCAYPGRSETSSSMTRLLYDPPISQKFVY